MHTCMSLVICPHFDWLWEIYILVLRRFSHSRSCISENIQYRVMLTFVFYVDQHLIAPQNKS